MEQLKCHSGAAPRRPLYLERRITHEHTEEKKTFFWMSDLMTSFVFLFIFEGTFSAATGKQTITKKNLHRSEQTADT